MLSILWPPLRDIAAFAVGAWILLIKGNATTTLQLIGFACLGIGASSVGQRIVEWTQQTPKRKD